MDAGLSNRPSRQDSSSVRPNSPYSSWIHRYRSPWDNSGVGSFFISFPDDPEFGMFDNTFERYDSIDQLLNSEFGIE